LLQHYGTLDSRRLTQRANSFFNHGGLTNRLQVFRIPQILSAHHWTPETPARNCSATGHFATMLKNRVAAVFDNYVQLHLSLSQRSKRWQ
jgi:hypothetical protein